MRPPIILRNKVWTLKKRVPARYRSVDDRPDVWMSLHTDSKTDALRRGAAVLEQLMLGWEDRLRGAAGDAERRYATATAIAKDYGYAYRPISDVAAMPLDKIVERVESIPKKRGEPVAHVAAALLGTVDKPALTVSKALEEYWTVTGDRLLGKSDDDVRRWRNPRIKAVKNFATVVADKDIAEITADDMQTFRRYWIDRIRDEDMTANSAKKDIGHLLDVLRTVNDTKQLSLPLAFGKLTIVDKGLKRERPPFSTKWITDKLLAPGALDGLNDQAAAILKVMIGTGARPSEIADLLPEHIHLSGPVPYIQIAKGKTANAARKLPLVGITLEAMRPFAKTGFPRYLDNPGLSGATNKFLRENGLLETDEHVVYSLRHSFESRMIAAGIEERLKCDLMGHAIKRERYGVTSLETLRDAMLKVEIKPRKT